jgi:hypothetical protein
MIKWKTTGKLDEIGQRLNLLVDQRRKAFAELQESGNWKRYYTEDAFLRRLREVAATSDAWHEVAGSGKSAGVPDSAQIEAALRRRRLQA